MKLLLLAWVVIAYVVPVAVVLLVPAERWPGFEPQPRVLLAWWLGFATLLSLAAGMLLYSACRSG